MIDQIKFLQNLNCIVGLFWRFCHLPNPILPNKAVFYPLTLPRSDWRVERTVFQGKLNNLDGTLFKLENELINVSSAFSHLPPGEGRCA